MGRMYTVFRIIMCMNVYHNACARDKFERYKRKDECNEDRWWPKSVAARASKIFVGLDLLVVDSPVSLEHESQTKRSKRMMEVDESRKATQVGNDSRISSAWPSLSLMQSK